MKKQLYIFILLFVSLFLWKCAQIIPLTGGEKDIYAPKIDSAKSNPYNGQTNFTEKEIELRFDEYIKLNNPNDNIIITPQLKNQPTYSVKNKKFKLIFNEELEENTTYTISFNGAIQDITERNDSVFQYVFSTGDYIDSLEISGKVSDAFTNEPIEKVLIALYPKQENMVFDSIPYLIKPTYIGITDKTGNYKIKYLKGGTYYVFAISDKNKDLKFNPGDEKIGFLNEQSIEVKENNEDVDFRLFSISSNDVKMKKKEFNHPGKFEIVFNQAPSSFYIHSNFSISQENTNKNDSLVYWLDESPKSATYFYYSYDSLQFDTLKPIYKGRPTGKEIEKLIFTNNLHQSKLLPKQNIIITSNEPVKNINLDLVKAYDKDSNEVKTNIFIENLRQIVVEDSTQMIQYLSFDSSAIESNYGHFNIDKYQLNIDRHPENYYGTLIIKIDSVFQSPIIVEVLDVKGNLIVSKNIDAGDNEPIVFKDMLPAKYKLRLIVDSNGDSKWSSGDLKNQIQPETVLYNNEDINIRSKWDFELDWLIKPE